MDFNFFGNGLIYFPDVFSLCHCVNTPEFPRAVNSWNICFCTLTDDQFQTHKQLRPPPPCLPYIHLPTTPLMWAIVYVAPHLSGYLHTDYIYGPSPLQFALLMSDFILLCYLLLLSYCLFIFPSQFRCTCTMTIKTYSLLFQISASDWQH